jgi:hypothetical protein
MEESRRPWSTRLLIFSVWTTSISRIWDTEKWGTRPTATIFNRVNLETRGFKSRRIEECEITLQRYPLFHDASDN